MFSLSDFPTDDLPWQDTDMYIQHIPSANSVYSCNSTRGRGFTVRVSDIPSHSIHHVYSHFTRRRRPLLSSPDVPVTLSWRRRALRKPRITSMYSWMQNWCERLLMESQPVWQGWLWREMASFRTSGWRTWGNSTTRGTGDAGRGNYPEGYAPRSCHRVWITPLLEQVHCCGG